MSGRKTNDRHGSRMIFYRGLQVVADDLEARNVVVKLRVERVMMSGPISQVKVFSATTAKRREELGRRVTDWIRDHPDMRVVRTMVRLSSDRAFHCLSIVLLCSNETEG